MELARVVLARSIWLFDTGEWNLKGKRLMPTVTDAIRGRYRFLQYPARVEDLDDTRGFKFLRGGFASGDSEFGVDIRGRSRTLRINYRTSHQIRTQADRLLGPVVTGVDGNSEERSDMVSVFNGLPPTIHSLKTGSEEIETVGKRIADRSAEGVVPHEFGFFVRSAAQLDRARAAVEEAGMAFKILDENVETTSGHVSVSTMHLAKGLEFRAVAVMACDDEIIPLQERIETVGDEADLKEVYDTERHLLYVACTRARDHLLVTRASSSPLLGLEHFHEYLSYVGILQRNKCGKLQGVVPEMCQAVRNPTSRT